MNKRRWIPHRQAYWPRLWPMQLVGGVLVLSIIVVLHARGLWTGLLGLGVGLVLPAGRIWVWKRRHPALSPEEWYWRMVNNAEWN